MQDLVSARAPCTLQSSAGITEISLSLTDRPDHRALIGLVVPKASTAPWGLSSESQEGGDSPGRLYCLLKCHLTVIEISRDLMKLPLFILQ